MLKRLYEGQVCSIARALEAIGDRWTPLIVRDTSQGPRRFDDLQHSLGLARNVLADRLQRLCDEGLLERRLYQERPRRYEYVATAKAHDLWPALLGLLQWGDKYYAPNGPPRLLLHRGCGGAMIENPRCSACGEALTLGDAEILPGPGATGLAAVSEPATA